MEDEIEGEGGLVTEEDMKVKQDIECQGADMTRNSEEGKGKKDVCMKEEEDGSKEQVNDEEVDGKEFGGEVDEGEDDDKEEMRNASKRSRKRTPRKAKKTYSGDDKVKSLVSEMEPVTPASDRPSRERKVVERFSVPDAVRPSAAKPLSIEKGSGTPLKDIPNVAFRLSKRKADEDLQMFHVILFGKKGKSNMLKRNIGQFSGFVWAINEEKQKAKVREKLEKCNKERLLNFCDLLNIPRNKAIVRKEELTAKILEFLESPHVTTDVLLAEKAKKSKKRKHAEPKQAYVGDKSVAHVQKKKSKSLDKSKRKVTNDEDNENSDEHSVASPEAENNAGEENNEEAVNADCDHLENDTEEEINDQKNSKSSSRRKKNESHARKSEKVPSKNPPKSSKKSVGSSSKRPVTDTDGADSNKKGAASKRQKTADNETVRNRSSNKKIASADSEKKSGKDKGKANSRKKLKAEPTKDEMQDVIVDLLKEVDFNTATLSDILRQLSKYFGIDLMHKKTEVKNIITEVINNMSDDDGGADNAGDEV